MLLFPAGQFFVCDSSQPLQANDSLWARALRGDNITARPWRGYAHRIALTPMQPHWYALEPLLRLAGASSNEKATVHYVVETDVSPENENDLNAWYEEEHLPGLAAVPGTILACRFKRVLPNGTPMYIACYNLTSEAVLESAPWLAVRNTAWSSKVRPMFVNPRRTLYEALT